MPILRFRQPEKNVRVFHSQCDGLAKFGDRGGVLSQARKGPCQGEASGSRFLPRHERDGLRVDLDGGRVIQGPKVAGAQAKQEVGAARVLRSSLGQHLDSVTVIS